MWVRIITVIRQTFCSFSSTVYVNFMSDICVYLSSLREESISCGVSRCIMWFNWIIFHYYYYYLLCILILYKGKKSCIKYIVRIRYRLGWHFIMFLVMNFQKSYFLPLFLCASLFGSWITCSFVFHKASFLVSLWLLCGNLKFISLESSLPVSDSWIQ